jgi:hypothetical protein
MKISRFFIYGILKYKNLSIKKLYEKKRENIFREFNKKIF